MMRRITELADRPVTQPRTVDRRLVGRCHHFTILCLSLMRTQGIAARARCGFGRYFNPGHFEDHWLVEYWNPDEERWVFVDPQFDDTWKTALSIEHDVLDVPRDQFLVAADAWELCRSDDADPSTCGIGFADLRGLWYVAGNLIRDAAALNKREMLPWDVWGAQPRPDEQLSTEALAFFDELARITRDPDAYPDDLGELYRTDARVRVPGSAR